MTVTARQVQLTFAALGWLSAIATICAALFVPSLSIERIAIPFVLAILCIVAGHIDRIETFKAGLTGFEGKTRELQAAVTEVRHLAAIMGRSFLPLLAAEGRYAGSASVRAKLAAREDLISQLERIGLAGKDLDDVVRSDQHYRTFDYNNRIKEVALKIDFPSSGWRRDDLLQKYNAFFLEKERFQPKTSSELRAFFEGTGTASADLTEVLADMEEFERSGRIRNIDRLIMEMHRGDGM